MSGYVEDSNGYYRPIGKKIGCVGHDCEECRNRQNTKPVAYWHKRGQEDEEFIHAEAVNGHCPDCEPLYIVPPKAEPVQEPYCYVYEYDGVFGMHREFYPKTYNGQKPSRTVPVYTAPPQRKPLTDEEIDAEWQKASECAYSSEAVVTTSQFVRLFARAVERAHGIGDSK